jgi:putative endonuclease
LFVLRRHPERSEGPLYLHLPLLVLRICLFYVVACFTPLPVLKENMPEHAYVYILASGFKKLYIGITTNLIQRISQHKRNKYPDSHTARYNIHDLVYYETFTSIPAAIKREKELKGWLRIRKLELIVSTNPLWKDLSADWDKPVVFTATE